MRKIFILLTLVLFSTSCVLAQDMKSKKKWGHFGLKTGVNVTHFNIEGSDGEPVKDLDTKWRTGFVFGAFVTIPLCKSFAIQPEFLYSSMGGDYEDGIGNKTGDRYNCFSLPVLAKYNFCKQWSVFLGPQVDVLIQGKESINSEKFKISDGLKDHDLLVTGGIEFRAARCITLAARYMRGFNDIDARSSQTKFLQEGAQLTIGITF